MADNENVIGLAMQLDVSNIKEGVKEVNKIIKSSKDEFNNATAGMDMWSKSSEGLNAKLGQLGKQLSAQQKLAAGYEAEIERVKNQEGDHTEELAKLNEKLQKTQNEIKKTQSQMSHYSDSLVTVEREEKDANSALGKLTDTISKQKKELGNLTKDYKSAVIQYGKNSREAKDLAKKIQQLSGEIEDNEKTVKKSEKAFDNLSRSLEDLGSKALEKSVKGVAKVGAAITGLVGSFLATAEGTRELRTNMGKVDTAFKESGFTAEQAENTYKKFYGVLGDEGQATEAVSHLAKLATSQEDLAKWTDICTGVYATFGDSLPIEGLTEAANETAKTGELTGGLADALNWVGISEDAFQDKLDKCSSEQERQKLITDTLTKSYGDASKQYQATNKDIIASQEAQAQLSQAMADIGAKAEPIMTQFKLMGAKMLEAMLPVIEKILPFVQEHLPALAIVAGTVTAAITTLATAIGILKLKTELATIATVAKTVAEKAATGATKAAAAAQWLLNAAMDANPIGLIVIAIAALVAAFVALWKKSEAFRNFWKGLWEGIKKYAKVAIDAIAKFFSACWDGIKKVFGAYVSFYKGVFNGIVKIFKGIPDALGKLFSKAWDAIKKAFSAYLKFYKGIFDGIVKVFSTIGTSLGKLFSGAWDKIKSAFTGVTKFFSGVASDVVDGFKSIPDKMKTVGKNLVEGLWNGVKNMSGWIKDKLKGFSDGVLNGIKDFFGIHSPSTVMAEVGGYMAEGLAEGLEDKSDVVEQAGINAGKPLINAGEKIGEEFANGVITGIDNGFNKPLNSFDKLTENLDQQKEKLAELEKQYKSAVLTFGSTSTQADSVALKIFNLTQEISENERKVNDLNSSYEDLNATMAKSIKARINELTLTNSQMQAELDEAVTKHAEALKNYDVTALQKYSGTIAANTQRIKINNDEIETLNKNLEIYTDNQKKAAEAATEAERKKKIAASEAKKAKKEEERAAKEAEYARLNDYEKLIVTINKQKEALEGLKTSYESALMNKDTSQINKLAAEIQKVTSEIEANENKVKSLDESYNALFGTIEEVAEEVEETLNSYDALLEKIKEQKEELARLKSEYQSALMSGENVDELTEKIKTLTSELEANENQVKTLNETYNNLFGTLEEDVPTPEIEVEIDTRKAWQKWFDSMEDALGLSENKLKKWSEGAGKYIEKFADYFSKMTKSISDLFKSITDIFNQNIDAKLKDIDAAITKLNDKTEKDVEAEQKSADEQLAIINKMYDEEKLSAEEYRKRKKKIEDDLAKHTKKKNDEAAAQEKKLLQEKDKLARKQFIAQKAQSIAEATINGANAILKGFAQLGPIGGAINAGVQAGITAAQIALISSQKYVPMLAKGGIADGATLAMIGEAGKEAVLPLEKNTDWMEALAEKLSAIMKKDMLSGVQPLTPAYAMSGGQTVVNNYYNQTINSPKSLTRREIYRDSKNLLALKG